MVRRILCGGMLLFWALALHAQVDKRWVKAETAIAHGKPYVAIRVSDKVLKGKGQQPRFLVLRSVAYNMVGEHTKALHDGMEVRTKVHGDTLERAYLQVGLALAALGRNDSAKHWLEKAYAGAHGDQARRKMAQILRAEGQCGAAIQLLDQVLRAAPHDAVAMRERGGCHAQLGDMATARVDLDRAVELAPKDAATWNSRGTDLHARSGQWEQAIADYERAIKLDPNYSFAFNNKGLALHRTGRTEQGIRAIKLAGRKRPNNPYVSRNLGLIALDQGDTALACAHFRAALALGFTAQYGMEMEEMVSEHCAGSTPIAPKLDAPARPARSNAPGRSNAP